MFEDVVFIETSLFDCVFFFFYFYKMSGFYNYLACGSCQNLTADPGSRQAEPVVGSCEQ